MTDESIQIGPEPEASKPEQPSRKDRRLETLAFLCADLARRGSDGERTAKRVIEVHPDGAAIAAVTSPPHSLTDLLFDELTDLESERLGVAVDRNLQNREPFAYYLRRRELAHHAEVVAVWGELPPAFVVIARTGADSLQSALAELGARMIAGIVLGKPDVDVHAMLRRLPSRASRRVLELVADTNEKRSDPPLVPPHDVGSADTFLTMFDRIVADPTRGPKRAADLLGRTLVATTFRRLDEELRKRARQLAVTVVVKKLEESEVFELEPGAPAWALAEALIDSVFLDASSGGGP